MSMESSPLGVRKGCWTEEEDILLRNCIEKYGEGKWHKVPQRAGLNRCRKSCRLRWLNYLNPNIKRGAFKSDEVDLIIRLHKLLGNRWTLIAGRIPGRTANDVKNYWNTHLRNKPVARRDNAITKVHRTTETKVIKPRPRRFTSTLAWFSGNTGTINVDINNIQSAGDSTLTNLSPLTSLLKVDDEILWCDNMELIESMGGSDDQEFITSLWTDEVVTGVQDGNNIGLNDFSVDDVDFWDLLC